MACEICYDVVVELNSADCPVRHVLRNASLPNNAPEPGATRPRTGPPLRGVPAAQRNRYRAKISLAYLAG